MPLRQGRTLVLARGTFQFTLLCGIQAKLGIRTTLHSAGFAM